MCVCVSELGTIGIFEFFQSQNMIFLIFYQVNKNISAPVLFKQPTPSQINLIKKAKNHFLLLKKFLKNPKVPSSGIISQTGFFPPSYAKEEAGS